jgi:FkbM family methyltransferase
VKQFLKKIFSLLPGRISLPWVYFVYHYYFVRGGQLKNELNAIFDVLKSHRRAIDIGANIGVYSCAFSKHFDHVEAFEPNASCTSMLADLGRSRGGIEIHHLGLSDSDRIAELYVPVEGESEVEAVGLASVNDPGGNRAVYSISLRRLDDFGFKEVDLIKIDVEGHEWEAIQGGIETIRRERPVLFIEIEQRHLGDRKIDDIINLICGLGYRGFYLKAAERHPIQEFSYERDQKPCLDNVYSEHYVANFLFTPTDGTRVLQAGLHA